MQRHCYLPLILVDQSILPPYSSTVVDKRSVNQATGCLTSASASANLHRGWFGGARVWPPAHLACTVTKPMEKKAHAHPVPA
jgi:hypothetical protein